MMSFIESNMLYWSHEGGYVGEDIQQRPRVSTEKIIKLKKKTYQPTRLNSGKFRDFTWNNSGSIILTRVN